jgi:hypothetical protein
MSSGCRPTLIGRGTSQRGNGYIGWLVSAPPHMIVTEAVVAPIRERGWP